MNTKRFLLQSTLALAAVAAFNGSALAQDKTSIKVGVTAGPHAQIFEQVGLVAQMNFLSLWDGLGKDSCSAMSARIILQDRRS